jgi:uncharacterized protein (DUF1697 family)
MGRYVALLRGINVGGKNKVIMTELAASFTQGGFARVTTYINSGNVLFESNEGDTCTIKARCEALLAAAYPFDIPVVVLSAEEIAQAMANAPRWWNTDATAANNAFYVIPPVTAQDVFAQVGAHKPAYEQVASHGRVIFWTAPRKTYARSMWSKIVQLPVYKSVTLRNANTALRLAQLMQQD